MSRITTTDPLDAALDAELDAMMGGGGAVDPLDAALDAELDRMLPGPHTDLSGAAAYDMDERGIGSPTPQLITSDADARAIMAAPLPMERYQHPSGFQPPPAPTREQLAEMLPQRTHPAEIVADVGTGLLSGPSKALENMVGGGLQLAGSQIPGAAGRALTDAGRSAEEFFEYAPQPQTSAGQIAQTVTGLPVYAAPALLTGGGAAVLGASPALAAGAATAVGGASGFISEGGGGFLESQDRIAERRLVEEGWITPDEAESMAGRTGIATGITGLLEVLPVFKIAKGAFRKPLGKAAQSVFGRISNSRAGHALIAAAGEGGQEAITELTTAVMQDLNEHDPLAYQDLAGRLAKAGGLGAVLGGGLGAMTHGQAAPRGASESEIATARDALRQMSPESARSAGTATMHQPIEPTSVDLGEPDTIPASATQAANAMDVTKNPPSTVPRGTSPTPQEVDEATRRDDQVDAMLAQQALEAQRRSASETPADATDAPRGEQTGATVADRVGRRVVDDGIAEQVALRDELPPEDGSGNGRDAANVRNSGMGVGETGEPVVFPARQLTGVMVPGTLGISEDTTDGDATSATDQTVQDVSHDFSSMTVSQLSAEAKRRGLRGTGSKVALIRRLEEATRTDQQSPTPSHASEADPSRLEEEATTGRIPPQIVPSDSEVRPIDVPSPAVSQTSESSVPSPDSTRKPTYTEVREQYRGVYGEYPPKGMARVKIERAIAEARGPSVEEETVPPPSQIVPDDEVAPASIQTMSPDLSGRSVASVAEESHRPDQIAASSANGTRNNQGVIEVDDMVVMHSPHTDNDVIVNYRGRSGDEAVVVMDSGIQMSVPHLWIRKQGTPYTAPKSVDPPATKPKKNPAKMNRSELIEEAKRDISSDFISSTGVRVPWETKSDKELRDSIRKRREEVSRSEEMERQRVKARPYEDAIGKQLEAAGKSWKTRGHQLADAHGVKWTPPADVTRGEATYQIADRIRRKGVPLDSIAPPSTPDQSGGISTPTPPAKETSTPSPDAKENAAKGKEGATLSADQFRTLLRAVAKSDDEADAVYALVEARAKAAGETVDQYVGRRIAGVQRSEGAPEGALEQAGRTSTDTPEFKRWFGDSKVVDADGKPLVVYKAMYPYDWRDGKPSEAISVIDRPSEFPSFNRGEPGVKIAGFFGSKDTANRFAEGLGGGQAVYQAYLSIKNPYVIDAAGKNAGDIQFGETGRPFRDAIKSGKYDGVIIKNTDDEGTVYVALRPTQIKSVNNRGTFDPANPNILEQQKKGAIQFAEDGRAIIHAFEAADVSTLVHEVGHLFRRDLSGEDLEIARRWAGAAKDKPWSRDAEEKFARGFERYLRNGKAPTEGLLRVFAQFKDWLSNIYRTIKGSEIDVKISPEMRGVYDRLFGETAPDSPKIPDSSTDAKRITEMEQGAVSEKDTIRNGAETTTGRPVAGAKRVGRSATVEAPVEGERRDVDGGAPTSGPTGWRQSDLWRRIEKLAKELGYDEFAHGQQTWDAGEDGYGHGNTQFSTSFRGDIPTEILEELTGDRLHLRSLLQRNVPTGDGADAYSADPERYMRVLLQMGESRTNGMLEHIRSAVEHDPQAAFLVHMHDGYENLPQREVRRQVTRTNRKTGKKTTRTESRMEKLVPPMEVVRDIDTLPPGSTIDIFGTTFEVVRDDGGITVLSTDDGETTFPVSWFDSLPLDAGSLKRAGQSEPESMAGVSQKGLFGRATDGGITGSQTSMFSGGKLGKAKYEEDAAAELDAIDRESMREKFRAAEQNTPEMFGDVPADKPKPGFKKKAQEPTPTPSDRKGSGVPERLAAGKRAAKEAADAEEAIRAKAESLGLSRKGALADVYARVAEHEGNAAPTGIPKEIVQLLSESGLTAHQPDRGTMSEKDAIDLARKIDGTPVDIGTGWIVATDRKGGKPSGGSLASFARSLPAPPQVPTIKPTRIQPDPLPDRSRKNVSEIIIDLGKSIKQVRTGSPDVSNAIGTYNPSGTKTVVRFAGDLDTTAHELGHALDDMHGVVTQWSTPRGFNKRGAALPQKSPFDDELRSPTFSQTTKKRYPVVMKRAEGVAEYIRAWLINPTAAEAAAPKFTAFFKEKVPAETIAKMREFGDDIRGWAGMPASERTLANVRVDMEKPGIVERLRESLSRPERGEFRITFLDKLNTELNDSFGIIYKAAEFAKNLQGIETLLPSRDPKILIQNYAGLDAKVSEVFDNGPIDASGERVDGVGGIKWLLEPLDSSSPEALQKDYEATMALMLNERVVERAGLLDKALADIRALEAESDGLLGSMDPDDIKRIDEIRKEINGIRKRVGYAGPSKKMDAWVAGKKQRMSGFGAGIYADDAQAKVALDELSGDPERLKRITEAASRYRKFADSILRYARDLGRLSPEQYDAITESNQFYVSFKRVIESEFGQSFPEQGKRLATRRDVVKRFSGSTREVENPYVSLIEDTARIMKEVDGNRAMRSFVDLLATDRAMYDGPPIDFDQIGRPVKQGEDKAVRIFRDGKPEYWQFEDHIRAAFANWYDVGDTSMIGRVASVITQFTKNTITYSPAFIVRNTIRDPISRAVLSEHGSKPWDQFAFVTPDGLDDFHKSLSEFQRYGGGLFGHYRPSKRAHYQQMKQALADLAGDENTILSLPGRAIGAYTRFSHNTETVGRLSEFKRAHTYATDKLGLSGEDASLYAANAARQIQDYAQAGRFIRKWNRYVLFLNSMVRGLSRTGQGLARDPLRFGMRWALYVGVPTVATYLWNAMAGTDDEERELPAYRRDLFWNIKAGPETWIIIPKPWEMGVVASGISRIIDAARGKDGAFKGYTKSLASAVSPDDAALVGPFRPMIEMMANHNFMTDKPIVPTYESEVALELRKGAAKSSRIGKIIGSALSADPRFVDNFINTQLGGFGRLATKVSDIGRSDKSGTGIVGTAAHSTGIVLSPTPYQIQSVSDAMDAARELRATQIPSMKMLRDDIDRWFASEDQATRTQLLDRIRERAKKATSDLEQRRGKIRQSK